MYGVSRTCSFGAITKRCITPATTAPVAETAMYSSSAVAIGHHEAVVIWNSARAAPASAATISTRSAGIRTASSMLATPWMMPAGVSSRSGTAR
jgi:hypothetical protein